jgi:putative flippase GtrA
MKGLGMVQLLRFGIVLSLGLGIDLAVALGLSQLVKLPLAAAGGFAAGALFNYLLHETWTFRAKGAGVQASPRRGALYVLVLGASFAARIGTVVALGAFWPSPKAVPAILCVAIGVSFMVNFLLSRNLVFRAPSTDDGPYR